MMSYTCTKPLMLNEGCDLKRWVDILDVPHTSVSTESSVTLYRLNHSKSLVGGTGEPCMLVRRVGRGLVVRPFIDPVFSSLSSELPTKEVGLHALFETTKAAYLS